MEPYSRGKVAGLSPEVSATKMKQNQSQAAMIRSLLPKQAPVKKIVERVKEGARLRAGRELRHVDREAGEGMELYFHFYNISQSE